MGAYNRFWLRFANIPFSLEQLDVYEKHFTVMNYNDADLQQMFCHDFIKLFEEQNPGHLWKDVESSIFSMFRGVFEGATALPPPCGIGSWRGRSSRRCLNSTGSRTASAPATTTRSSSTMSSPLSSLERLKDKMSLGCDLMIRISLLVMMVLTNGVISYCFR